MLLVFSFDVVQRQSNIFTIKVCGNCYVESGGLNQQSSETFEQFHKTAAQVINVNKFD